MPALRISDLAAVVIEELAPRYGYTAESIEVRRIGKRPGEKSYEELLTEDETIDSYETEDMFIISQTGKNREVSKTLKSRYTSRDATLLTKEEIREILIESLPQFPRASSH
jgi:FlaA1/EpsC-like NDP-sugar epimerase